MSPSNKAEKQTVRERIEEFLLDPANAGLSNAEIAKRLGINAGSVRRARTPDKDERIADLLDELALANERNERLEEELKKYKANAPKPTRRHDPNQPVFKAIRELIHEGL